MIFFSRNVTDGLPILVPSGRGKKVDGKMSRRRAAAHYRPRRLLAKRGHPGNESIPCFVSFIIKTCFVFLLLFNFHTFRISLTVKLYLILVGLVLNQY